MPKITDLRSCYDKVGRLIYFGRMLDKIGCTLLAGSRPNTHDFLVSRTR
jgi:hypothetical protein